MRKDFYEGKSGFNSLFWDLSEHSIEPRSYLNTEEFLTEGANVITNVIFYMYQDKIPMIIAIINEGVVDNIDSYIEYAMEHNELDSQISYDI